MIVGINRCRIAQNKGRREQKFIRKEFGKLATSFHMGGCDLAEWLERLHDCLLSLSFLALLKVNPNSNRRKVPASNNFSPLEN
jgi:hypothetical protein